ncbi:MAG TPA: hypothetical protein VEK38_03875 [Candidatus Bathyarchaeia archaeon]|nr:hypothetical protein [Candidatus Bathyarchaeia archaeon]
MYKYIFVVLVILTGYIQTAEKQLSGGSGQRAMENKEQKQGWRNFASSMFSTVSSNISSTVSNVVNPVSGNRKSRKKQNAPLLTALLPATKEPIFNVVQSYAISGDYKNRDTCQAIFLYEVDTTEDPAYFVIAQSHGEKGIEAAEIVRANFSVILDKNIEDIKRSITNILAAALTEKQKILQNLVTKTCTELDGELAVYEGKGTVHMASIVTWKDKALCCVIGDATFLVAQPFEGGWAVKQEFRSENRGKLGAIVSEKNSTNPIEFHQVVTALKGGARLIARIGHQERYLSHNDMAGILSKYEVPAKKSELTFIAESKNILASASRLKFITIPYVLNTIAMLSEAAQHSKSADESSKYNELISYLSQNSQKNIVHQLNEAYKDKEGQITGILYVLKDENEKKG